MRNRRLTCLSAAALLAYAAAPAAAMDLVVDYNRGANDPLQLGSDFIIDQAQTGGGDAQSADGFFGWVAEYTDMWDVGTNVSLTGLAVPIHNGTGTTSVDGDWTFTFFELDGGADPNGFDGYSFQDMTGETVLGSFTAGFIGAGTNEYYLNFDTPLNFTAASTGLAFHMQSTESMRVKVRPAGLETSRGVRVGLGDGTPIGGANPNFRATLAGTPVAQDPPPPPGREHRFVASTDTPGNAVWTPVEPSLESFNFGADTSSVPVSDSAVPGITAAYNVGSRGQPNIFEGQINGQSASRQDASFEVWFKPDDLTGGDQIIYEAGGSGSGAYISLQGDQLSFFLNGVFSDRTLTTTLTEAEWTQVVAVIHNTFEATDPSEDDFIELYINGQPVGSTAANLGDFNDWAGGNDAGLGQDGQTIASLGPIDNSLDDNATISFPFAGEIAIFEYTAAALTAQDVLDRYNAITTAPAGLAGDYTGDGVVDSRDYALFRDNLGGDASVFAAGSRDPSNSGVVNAADLAFWQANYGASQPGSASAVPEPTSLIALIGVAAFARRRR